MYAFPPTAEVQFLLSDDAALTQIVLDSNQLTLMFDNGCKIASQHRAAYERGDVREEYREWRDTPAISLHHLLERKLICVWADDLRLTLEFDNEAKVEIFSDLSNFEAGQIYRAAGSLIVF